MRVLIVEDDTELNETITKYLTKEGFTITQCFDALCAKEQLRNHTFDLLLLDVKIPYQDGFRFLEENDIDTPTIYITSLNSIEDIERGFKAGAVEYIKKPFYLKELKLRIDSLFKNKKGPIPIGPDLAYDPDRLIIHTKGQELHIKPKEAQLLEIFLEAPGKIVDKLELLHRLYPHEPNSEGALRAQIKNLRKIIGKERIQTIKEVGYRFVPK
ncbi:MAG: two-component system response regulator [Epsilonproteobacteria bacterium]|nr:two-component system response regulator [Campylobacterota bacterium]NPA63604.1 response regulator transcription factor [Campylobacterota bacterium]